MDGVACAHSERKNFWTVFGCYVSYQSCLCSLTTFIYQACCSLSCFQVLYNLFQLSEALVFLVLIPLKKPSVTPKIRLTSPLVGSTEVVVFNQNRLTYLNI